MNNWNGQQDSIPLSERIKACRDGVIHNPYQSDDKRVLFVCSMGILRSATAARLYGHKYNTRCVGTWDEALIRLDKQMIDWADEIVFVNSSNFQNATDKFGYGWHDKTKVLNIPDDYPHMAPELVQAFVEQYEPL